MKTWLHAAFNRAIRTFFQTLVASLGTSTMFSEVEWKIVLSTSLFASLLSICTSFATNLPEVKETEE